MIGNFYIEAGLKPNNVEDSSGFDDETYTKNVDNGTYSKESFVNDGAGYGLAQWTYSSRKKALYEYAKEKGTSIGDLNMQMEFLWKEMNSTHKSGLNYMKQNGDKSVDSLTEYFCWEFENPGVPHMNERKRYANDIYEKYKNNHNNSNNKCSFNINLYKSNGSVDKSKISQLKTEEDKIINSYRGYKFFNNNGLSYLQCTWWANARASTYLSKFGTKYKSYPTNNGNGGDYWQNNKNGGWFKYGNTPRANSLLGYSAGSIMGQWGHITYVEAVDPVNKKIYISHCSSRRKMEWYTRIRLEWYALGTIATGIYIFRPT